MQSASRKQTPNLSVNTDLCNRRCAPLAQAGYLKRYASEE